LKVLIVDDDRLVSSALKTILEADPDIQVVGAGSSGREALELYERLLPDVLLMDIRMGDMTGLEAAEQLLKEDKERKILFLTTFSDDEYIVKALQIGAKGYILKQNFESIVPAVKTVYAGQRVYGNEIIDKIPALMGDGSKRSVKNLSLSEKELEIIAHVANGLSNKEIADALFLGEGTVRNYISIILEKLHLRDRTQLAIFYYRNRI
jgi:DNA-binding NarL/FixJ family response regulator